MPGPAILPSSSLLSLAHASRFSDPVPCYGVWEALLHGLDRLLRLPSELPAEAAEWERRLGQLRAVHAGLLAGVAAGAPALEQRERDVTAQVGGGGEGVRGGGGHAGVVLKVQGLVACRRTAV